MISDGAFDFAKHLALPWVSEPAEVAKMHFRMSQSRRSISTKDDMSLRLTSKFFGDCNCLSGQKPNLIEELRCPAEARSKRAKC